MYDCHARMLLKSNKNKIDIEIDLLEPGSSKEISIYLPNKLIRWIHNYDKSNDAVIIYKNNKSKVNLFKKKRETEFINEIRALKKVNNFKKYNQSNLNAKHAATVMKIIKKVIKMRIYAVIEIKRRELYSRILFATYLASKGWSVVIGSKEDILSKIRLLKKGYYFFKSIQHRTKNFFKSLKDLNFKIAALDEEGLMHYQDEYYLRRVSGERLKEVSKFFCWGRKDYDLLSKTYPESSSKLVVAGNTRLSLLNENFRNLYEDEINKIQKIYGDFILISPKFGKINFVPRKKYKEYIQGQISAGYVKTETSLKTAKKQKNMKKKILRNILNYSTNSVQN